MEYLIKQYPLDSGALEIQYMEEYFGEFPRKKTAAEIIRRLQNREFLILMAEAPLPDDPGTIVPVAFKIVSTNGRCSTAGSAARVATGVARAISARSPRNRRRGRMPRASTKWS
jgi:hypothetical protein